MDSQAPDAGPSDDYSYRSRASSIVSTGTKTSVGTFLTSPFIPQMLPSTAAQGRQSATDSAGNVLDIILGRRNFRISARPGSVLSISSFDVPAPPYSEALNDPTVPVDVVPFPRNLETGNNQVQFENITQTTQERRRQRSGVSVRPSTAETDNTVVPEPAATEEDDDGPVSITSSPSRPSSPIEATENAISAHYTNVVRTIDSNHRAEVARLHVNHQAELSALGNAQQAEIEALRSELEAANETSLAATRNEIDGVYRGEFARMRQEQLDQQAAFTALERENQRLAEKATILEAQVRVMAKAEQEATALHTSEIAQLAHEKAELHKSAYEKERAARNEVEDTWERRWRDRMNIAKEQDAKANREFEFWLAEVELRWPGSGETVREAVRERVKTDEESRKTRKTRKWPSFGTATGEV